MLQSEEPKAVYTHCYGHALSLACMKEELETSHELIKLVKKSPCRDSLLQKLKEQMPNDSSGIQVRAQALHSILANYKVLQILWDKSLEIVKDAEMRS